MRTNIEIDDRLMRQTILATGARTKREAVELAMKSAVQLHQQAKTLKRLRGIAVRNPDLWDAAYDYKKMRAGRTEW